MHVLDWLNSRMLFGIKVGLENILAICARLHNPEKKFRSIHVVGTNGKGSTAFWIAQILQAHGVRTGLFTSPHLVSVRERIVLDNQMISPEDLNDILEQVRKASNGIDLTYFEALTAAAFLWFVRQGVELAVLEAGMGGRLDSTNAAPGDIVVLTSIGLDHTEYLGNTRQEILREKLGIWKKGALLIHALDDFALQKELAEYPAPGLMQWIKERENIEVPHQGKVYRRNASLAWEASNRYLGESFNEIRAAEALRHAVWAGRIQKLHGPQGKLEWILDGAHNGHAAEQLADTLGELGEQVVLVFACLQTKNPREILEPLTPFVRKAIFTRTEHPKMREPEEYGGINCSWHQVEFYQDFRQAMAVAALESGIKLITGSLYFVGAAVSELCTTCDELQKYRGLHRMDNEAGRVEIK